MATREELLAEAYRRGLLPPDKKAAFEEAQRRGLIRAAEPEAPPEAQPDQAQGLAAAFKQAGVSPDNPRRYEALFMEPEREDATGSFLRSVEGGLIDEHGMGVLQAASELLRKAGLDRAADTVFPPEAKNLRELRKAEQAMQTADHPVAGAVGQIVGQAAPAVAVPGGMQGNLLKRALTGGAAGAGIGAVQYVDEGESRAANAIAGGAVGSAAPAVVAGAVKAGTKAVNAARGRFADEAAQKVVETGAKHGVPVYAPDVMGSPGAAKLGVALEEVPVIGMRTPRLQQMEAAKSAATNVTEQLKQNMLNQNFGGANTIPKLQQLAAGGGARAKAAQSLLDDIANAGDDWQRIVQASGNLKALRLKMMADAKYDRLTREANKFGVVPPTNALAALDDAIIKAESAAMPDQALVRRLQTVRDSLTSKPRSYSELRDVRGEVGGLLDDFYKGSNAVVGSRGANLLTQVKGAIERDMDEFAQANGPQLRRLWKEADSFYRNNVVPLRDRQLARALKDAEPDEVYKYILNRNKEASNAQKFYDALDAKGRAAVNYGMAREALEGALDAQGKTFSPAKFASNLENLQKVRGVFLKGEQAKAIQGFSNLMRAVQRSGQAAENPATGNRLVPFAMGGGAVGLYQVSPTATLATLGTAKGLQWLFTNPVGRNLLLAASSAQPGSPAMQRLVNHLQAAAAKAGVVAAVDASGPATSSQAQMPAESPRSSRAAIRQ
jgi:hypothetical protein